MSTSFDYSNPYAALVAKMPAVRLTLPNAWFFKIPPAPFPRTLPSPPDHPTLAHPFTVSSDLYNSLLNGWVPFTIAIVYITVITALNSLNKSRNYTPWAFSKTRLFHLMVITHNIILAVYSAWTFVGMFNALERSVYNPYHEWGVAGMVDSLCKLNGPRGFGSAAVYNERHAGWTIANRFFHLGADGLGPDATDVGRIWNEGLAFYGWLFYLSKFYEVIDTLIIISKGKKSSFLQTYHHAGAMICMWAGIRYMSPPIWMFVLVNSFIHTIMYSFYLCTAIGIRVPVWFKRSLTTLQIAQFVVGAAYAFIHLVVEYQSPVSRPYHYNPGSPVEDIVSDVSSVISTATATVSANLGAHIKKALLRAAGREGLAENVLNDQGRTFGTDAEKAAKDLYRRQTIEYRDELEWTHCLDTSGQAFAIYLNVLYLLPLTVLFSRFFIKSYLRRLERRRSSTTVPVPIEKRAHDIRESFSDATKGTRRSVTSLGEPQEGDEDTDVFIDDEEFEEQKQEVKKEAKKAWREVDQTVRNTATSASQKINEGIESAKKNAGPAAQDAKKKAESAAESASQSIKNASKKVNQNVESAKKNAGPVVQDATEKAESAAENTSQTIRNASKKVNQSVKSAKESAGPVVQDTKEKVESAADSTSQTIKNVSKEVNETLAGENEGMNRTLKDVKQRADSVKAQGESISEKGFEKAEEVYESVKTSINDAKDGLIDNTGVDGSKVKEAVEEAKTKGSDTVQKGAQVLQESAESVSQSVQDTASSVKENVASKVEPAVSNTQKSSTEEATGSDDTSKKTELESSKEQVRDSDTKGKSRTESGTGDAKEASASTNKSKSQDRKSKNVASPKKSNKKDVNVKNSNDEKHAGKDVSGQKGSSKESDTKEDVEKDQGRQDFFHDERKEALEKVKSAVSEGPDNIIPTDDEVKAKEKQGTDKKARSASKDTKADLEQAQEEKLSFEEARAAALEKIQSAHSRSKEGQDVDASQDFEDQKESWIDVGGSEKHGREATSENTHKSSSEPEWFERLTTTTDSPQKDEPENSESKNTEESAAVVEGVSFADAVRENTPNEPKPATDGDHGFGIFDDLDRSKDDQPVTEESKADKEEKAEQDRIIDDSEPVRDELKDDKKKEDSEQSPISDSNPASPRWHRRRKG